MDELVGFLSDPKPDVRMLALQTITGYTASEEGKQSLKNIAALIPSLVKFIGESSSLSQLALTSLINLSEDEEMQVTIATRPGVIEAIVAIITDENPQAQFGAMLLSNITRNPVGVSQFLQLGDKMQGYFFCRCADIFVNNADQPAYADAVAWLATTFQNCTQMKEGRELILDKNRKMIVHFLRFIKHPNVIRRRGILAAVRNCCFETEYYDWLLSAEMDLLGSLLSPLRGNEELSPEDMEGMSAKLHNSACKHKVRETDKVCLKTILETLQLFTSRSISREQLNAQKVYPVLRDYHKQEKDEALQDEVVKIVEVLLQDEK